MRLRFGAMDPPVAAGEAKPAHPIRRFFRKIGPAGPVALIVTAMPAVGTLVLLGFASRVWPWLRGHGWVGVAVFIVIFAVLNGFALMTTYANSLLAGWTFKFAVGLPTVLASLAGAAMIGYALTARIVGHRVQDVIAEHPRWEIVRQALIGGSTLRSFAIVTLLRLSPLLPFETTNAVLAMCGVRPLPYFAGTIVGIAPRVAAVVWAASTMHELTLERAPHPLTLVAGLAITAASLLVVTIVARHALHRACAVPAPAPSPSVPPQV